MRRVEKCRVKARGARRNESDEVIAGASMLMGDGKYRETAAPHCRGGLKPIGGTGRTIQHSLSLLRRYLCWCLISWIAFERLNNSCFAGVVEACWCYVVYSATYPSALGFQRLSGCNDGLGICLRIRECRSSSPTSR